MAERMTLPESDFSVEFNDTSGEPKFCIACSAGPLREAWWMSDLRGPYCGKCIERRAGSA